MSFPYVTDIVDALLGTQMHLPIPTFGMMVALAVLIATAVARREVARLETLGKLPHGTQSLVADLALVSGIAGIVGARAFHVIDHFDRFAADPVAMVVSRAGFSIYGGLCFGIAAGIWFLRRRAVPIAPMLDATAPSMMLGYAVGRLGCQLAGDGDWGIRADMASKPGWLPDWLWAQTYDGNILGVTIPAPGVYPTPLYESLAAFVLFAMLWSLRAHRERAGFLFCLYLVLAGFERLLIEKIRINPQHELLGLTLSQAEIISVVAVIAGLIGSVIALRSERRWTRALFALAVAGGLTACVPL